MQDPLTRPSPEGDYRRLERRKEAHSKSTHLAPVAPVALMVADPEVAPVVGGDPLPAGRIVPRVRRGPCVVPGPIDGALLVQ